MSGVPVNMERSPNIAKFTGGVACVVLVCLRAVVRLRNPVSDTRCMSACRCDVALAHQEAAEEDAQGPAQGGLYRRLAPGKGQLLHRARRAEGLPPPHREEQEGTETPGARQYMCRGDTRGD